MTRRTLAGPMAWLFASLVVYASLYPFVGWRAQGIPLWGFLLEPLPRYWLPFDVFANFVGYMPLGFLLAVTVLRSGGGRAMSVAAFVVPALLSLSMETLQVFLPGRVPSNVDWALNTVGGTLGAALALGLSHQGWLARWQRVRLQLFVPHAHGALLLMAVWPLALLYPTSLPFGLGQVWGGVDAAVVGWLAGTALEPWWLASHPQNVPLAWVSQSVCVALGVLGPGLLGHSVLRGLWFRVGWGLGVGLVAAGWMGLSHALTHGPVHAWAWLTPPVGVGLVLAACAGTALSWVPRRVCVVGLVCVLVAGLALLNRAPQSPYLDVSLEIWAQGRFSRFHGLTQWLGWLWPYAALVHAFTQATRSHMP